jgi:hypothetical protein
MNPDATIKIEMLNGSLSCFKFGLLGLLPVIGLPFALATLRISGQVRLREKQFWNPARPYRVWGVVCAALGTIFWMGIILFAVFQAVMDARGDY